MAERGRSAPFRAPEHRLGYDKWLFAGEEKTVAKGPNAGQKFREWGASLIYPKSTDKGPFERAILEACVNAKWGDEAKIRDLIANRMIKSPFLDGAGPEARAKKGDRMGELHPGLGPDVWFLRVNSRKEPVIRWRSASIPATPEEVYNGSYGFAVLTAYTWEGETGKGVSFGLDYLQKTRDGERLWNGGAPVDAEQYYETVENTGAAPAATQGGAGAGALFGG